MAFDAENKVWCGPNDPYLYGELGIGEAIFEFMNDNPDHMIEIADDESEVFIAERMKSVSIRIAENLLLKGIKPGQPIVLILKNHPLDSPILIACMFVGAIVCVLPHDLNIEKYRRILSEVKPKMVLVTEKSLAKQMLSSSVVANVQTKFYMLDNELATCYDLKDLVDFKVQTGEEFCVSKCENPDKDIALILVSSQNSYGNGLTLVNVTHKMIMRDIKQDDLFSNTVISASNFSHPMEVIRAIKGFMTPVTRIVSTPDEFSAALFLHSIRKNDVSELFIDLTEANNERFLEYLHKTEFLVRGLEKVTLFGTELNNEIARIGGSLFPGSKVTFQYVMYEFGGSVFSHRINNTSCALGKIGSHLKAKIVEEDGRTFGPDEVGIGELLIGSAFKIPGYLNSPMKNGKKFTEDEYFHTGLHGYFDNNGEFYLIEPIKKSPSKNRYSK